MEKKKSSLIKSGEKSAKKSPMKVGFSLKLPEEETKHGNEGDNTDRCND